MTCVYLSAEDVAGIARHAVGEDVVVRDAGLLGASAHRPSAAPFAEEVYNDLFQKAAALLQSLAFNRAFVDGNRRTAWVSCVVFLALNDVHLRSDIDAAERLVTAVAAGDLEEVPSIAAALRELAE
ncbi:type II toxin-antitoxin system death-on-curing family toxin [Streptomyces ferrugineus]|uniref:Type II toxin-antitoxin system death-on-curing family toxin n=1 Tax=Streptomyces ferrugineus TaxID=1413221 RepID=A0A7M2SP45_9ACTN|nr:type II toxin-antitoxin system death-on-curing family toxin [Streptomyces ferrugineus]QOV38024.1 type II toxin-antitoxin system death-on-curing family toxin [Streptomyces ferrugineus]